MTVELHGLAQTAVQTVLSSSEISSKTVEAALRNLQGPFSLAESYPDLSNIPYADMQELNGFSTLVAAFAVMRGGSGIPVILPYLQFYSHAGGTWRIIEETGSNFEGCAVSLARIPPPSADHEVWYLVWGRTIGDTGARLKMEVLGFNGLNVRSIWSRDGLEGGSVSVASGRVRLAYYENLSPGDGTHGPAKHLLEILRPNRTGLELVERSELPQ